MAVNRVPFAHRITAIITLMAWSMSCAPQPPKEVGLKPKAVYPEEILEKSSSIDPACGFTVDLKQGTVNGLRPKASTAEILAQYRGCSDKPLVDEKGGSNTVTFPKANLRFRGREHRHIQIDLLKLFPGSFVPDLKDGSHFTVKKALGPVEPVISGPIGFDCFSSRIGAVLVEYDGWGALEKPETLHTRVTRIFMFEEPCLTVLQILRRADHAKYGWK